MPRTLTPDSGDARTLPEQAERMQAAQAMQNQAAMQQQTAQSAPSGPASGSDWRATLPEDWKALARTDQGEMEIRLRDHPLLAKYGSKDEAVKALVHAQRLIGDDSGRPPASPDAYELPEMELPEGFPLDEALQSEYLQRAHELGLSPAQAAGLYSWFVPKQADAYTGEQTARTEYAQAEYARLRRAFPGQVEQVLDRAGTTIAALGGEPLARALGPALDNAEVLAALARVAPLLSEGRMRSGLSGGAAPTPEGLRKMIADPRYSDPQRRDPDFVRQVADGYKALYPGKRR